MPLSENRALSRGRRRAVRPRPECVRLLSEIDGLLLALRRSTTFTASADCRSARLPRAGDVHLLRLNGGVATGSTLPRGDVDMVGGDRRVHRRAPSGARKAIGSEPVATGRSPRLADRTGRCERRRARPSNSWPSDSTTVASRTWPSASTVTRRTTAPSWPWPEAGYSGGELSRSRGG